MKRSLPWFVFGVVLFVLIGTNIVLGLGISPAIVDMDFQPNKRVEIGYKVDTNDPDQKVGIFVKGALSEYVQLSKTEFIGSDSFTVVVLLPATINQPGPQIISIGAEEVPDKRGAIGTAVKVIGIIRVFVPYPGKYIEGDLKISDGNIDEDVPFEVYLVNRGKESLNVNVNVNFYDDMRNLVGAVPFSEEIMLSGEEVTLEGVLSAKGYRPGDYFAEADIDYSGQKKVLNKTFRIGSLFVEIVNFTDSLEKGSIEKFLIRIKSKWNGKLENVFADINISNYTSSVLIRTPAVDLEPWESKVLEGFLDTGDLEGEYDSLIVLNYKGEQSSVVGKLLIYDRQFGFWKIAVLIGIVILIGLAVFFVWRRNNKDGKKN